MLPVGDAEEVVASTPRRGKRKPLSADLPRVEVTHELPEHELTCACGCRKHVIGEETSEQLEIVPMQIRVLKHIRKVYGCRGCETAPVTADKPAQMLLTTKYVDDLPLHRFKNVLSRHGVDIPKANTGALGYPVRRTLPALAEFNARPITGKSGHPLVGATSALVVETAFRRLQAAI